MPTNEQTAGPANGTRTYSQQPSIPNVKDVESIVDESMGTSLRRMHDLYGGRNFERDDDVIEDAAFRLINMLENDRSYRRLSKRARKLLAATSADMVATAAVARSATKSGEIDRTTMRVIADFARFLMDGLIER